MIDNSFLQRIGLNNDQIILIMDALSKEARFRTLLNEEHITHTDAIIKVTDLDKIDFSNEDLLREKIKCEWAEFITKKT